MLVSAIWHHKSILTMYVCLSLPLLPLESPSHPTAHPIPCFISWASYYYHLQFLMLKLPHIWPVGAPWSKIKWIFVLPWGVCFLIFWALCWHKMFQAHFVLSQSQLPNQLFLQGDVFFFCVCQMISKSQDETARCVHFSGICLPQGPLIGWS